MSIDLRKLKDVLYLILIRKSSVTASFQRYFVAASKQRGYFFHAGAKNMGIMVRPIASEEVLSAVLLNNNCSPIILCNILYCSMQHNLLQKQFFLNVKPPLSVTAFNIHCISKEKKENRHANSYSSPPSLRGCRKPRISQCDLLGTRADGSAQSSRTTM